MKFCKNTWLPDADTYFEGALAEDGTFQIGHLTQAFAWVRGWNHALDVGAHVGTWTRVLASKFNQVTAMEPAPDTYMCLLKNTHHLKNVRPLRMAASSRLGRVVVVDDVARPGNTGSRYLATVGQATAMAIDIDSMHIEFLDLVKVDVEGHELEVLRGARDSLLKHRPVVILEVKDLGRGDDYLAASRLLESWGATEVSRSGKDRVYTWRDDANAELSRSRLSAQGV